MIRAVAAAAALCVAAPILCAQADEMPAALPDWSGFYLGVTGGYTKPVIAADGLAVDDHFSGLEDGRHDFDMSDWSVGGTIGYNLAVGRVMVGIETDLSWSPGKTRLRASSAIDEDVSGMPVTGYGEAEIASNIQWMSTVRPRVGFLAGNLMPYVTGGLAVGHGDVRVSTSFDANDGSAFGSESMNERVKTLFVGWTAGAGVEGLLGGGLSAKAEYLYYDLGSRKYSGTVDGVDIRIRGALDGHLARVGLNYRF